MYYKFSEKKKKKKKSDQRQCAQFGPNTSIIETSILVRLPKTRGNAMRRARLSLRLVSMSCTRSPPVIRLPDSIAIHPYVPVCRATLPPSRACLAGVSRRFWIQMSSAVARSPHWRRLRSTVWVWREWLRRARLPTCLEGVGCLHKGVGRGGRGRVLQS